MKCLESFGAHGCCIEPTDELARALRTALSPSKLTMIDCPVDALENLRLTKKLGTLAVPTGFHP